MTTMQTQPPADVTIPAAYLEDMRSALVVEINHASHAVQTDQDDVLTGSLAAPEDRAAAVRLLREDIHLLDQVLAAAGDTTAAGERDAVTHALETMVRVLSGRLDDACRYEPIGMGAVLDLAERLRWAATEAIRIEPGLDERKVS